MLSSSIMENLQRIIQSSKLRLSGCLPFHFCCAKWVTTVEVVGSLVSNFVGNLESAVKMFRTQSWNI